MSRILVIRHGALGDIILSFPAMAAIRAQHAKDDITLLTTGAYAALLSPSPWFDRVLVDEKPAWWHVPGLLRLRQNLQGFDMVYDLQTSSRSTRYFALAGRPPWSGIAKGCAYPDGPGRTNLHTRERLEGQLAAAGIAKLPQPDLDWLRMADVAEFNLPEKYVLLVPGASAHRPEKRWPAEKFRELSNEYKANFVLVGGPGEQLPVLVNGQDLIGRTSLLELAAITARASLAIGNDTGPMHLAAALAVPCVCLFSAASNPALTAPRYPDGGWPKILRAQKLADLPVAQILSALP